MFTVVIRKELRTGGNHKRWKIESLANCVPNHLLIKEAFPFIGRHTVEARSTIVHSATNHTPKLVI